MNNSVVEIKIAFVIWTFAGMGGSERVIYDIVRILDKRQYTIILISFEDGQVKGLYEKLGIKTYVIQKLGKNDSRVIYEIRKILIDEAVDIVNPHHFGPFLYTFIATRLSKVKLVYTEHSRWQLEQLSTLKKVLNRIMLWRSDAVVAISKQIQDYYIKNLHLDRKKVHLINNGIEIDSFKKMRSKRLLQSLGIDDYMKVVGIVANLRPEKNHKLLISAFSNVAIIMKDVRLLIVGLDCMDGEVQHFASQSSASDKIYFLGMRDDIPDLLNIFDIFCLPSLYEGLPLTILEAMAADVPVIGADTLGINEVIVNNVNGLIFLPNDEEKLTESLCMLLEDSFLRERLSSAGKAFVIQNHSLDDKVNEYDELFRSVYHIKSTPW